jgi:hypothetical protein
MTVRYTGLVSDAQVQWGGNAAPRGPLEPDALYVVVAVGDLVHPHGLLARFPACAALVARGVILRAGAVEHRFAPWGDPACIHTLVVYAREAADVPASRGGLGQGLGRRVVPAKADEPPGGGSG